jgi:hypothetical protein
MEPGLTLARFKLADRFVDHVDTAAALHHAAVFVTILQGLQRVNDFHGALLSVRLPPARERLGVWGL